MKPRWIFSAIAAPAMLSASVLAQTSSPATARPQSSTQSTQREATTSKGTPITLVGCIQRESDYRREHDSGRGGALGTGAGLNDEYVLIHAMKTSDGTSASAPADCASTSTGEAYELSGARERDLKAFVGRAVEISGTLKPAATKPETSGTTGATTPRPTGGFDPLKQDLKLFEVDVTSFKAVNAAAPGGAVQAPAPTTPQPRESPAPPASTPAPKPQSTLPKTATPLPLVGLAGLILLCAAAGIRWRRAGA